MPKPLKVMFFCLGNICRSPLAEGLFRYHAEQRGLGDRFHIESSGTSSYHVGEAPDPGSIAVAKRRLGLDISGQRSQKLTPQHVQEFDLLVAMDESNRRVAEGFGFDKSIRLLREWEKSDPSQRGAGVPDPWGGGTSQFDLVFDIVNECCVELLDELEQQS